MLSQWSHPVLDCEPPEPWTQIHFAPDKVIFSQVYIRVVKQTVFESFALSDVRCESLRICGVNSSTWNSQDTCLFSEQPDAEALVCWDADWEHTLSYKFPISLDSHLPFFFQNCAKHNLHVIKFFLHIIPPHPSVYICHFKNNIVESPWNFGFYLSHIIPCIGIELLVSCQSPGHIKEAEANCCWT